MNSFRATALHTDVRTDVRTDGRESLGLQRLRRETKKEFIKKQARNAGSLDRGNIKIIKQII